MYHYAMHETKNSKCPVHLLKVAKQSELEINTIWEKEPYVLNNVYPELSAVNTIFASLKSGINMGISEYAEMYPVYEGCDSDTMIDSITIDLKGLSKYGFNNIDIMKSLYRICNGDMKTVKFAFDVLLSLTMIKGNRQ